MILAALLVEMTNPRCQKVHREVDEGLGHRDAMNAHQSARNRCFGTSKDIVVVLTAHSCSRRMGGCVDRHNTLLIRTFLHKDNVRAPLARRTKFSTAVER